MRAVLQRVSQASVKVDGKTVSAIGRGFLVLLGIARDDEIEALEWSAKKIAGLRIFEDEQDKMNLSLAGVGGEVLVVSQFTLHADVRKGRRPAFLEAAPPEKAEPFYEKFCELLEAEGVSVKKGVFGAKMEIGLVNEGPVTILVERQKNSS